MPQTVSGDHRDVSTAGGDHRTQDQADEIADSARGVLVEHGTVQARPAQDPAAVAHGESEGHLLAQTHAPEPRRHGECRNLRVADTPAADARDEAFDLARIELQAVALLQYEYFYRVHVGSHWLSQRGF